MKFDAILEYNQGKWGGRYNPIILTDGSNIEEKWWKFLCDADPDVIESLVPLGDSLLNRIERFLSPYLVSIPGKLDEKFPRYFVPLHDEGLSIFPTSENVARASRSFMGDSKLVLFELDRTADELTKQFIRRNFGTITHTVPIDRLLDIIEKKIFPITDTGSLATALGELSTFERFVYPIQICSIPNTLQDVKCNRMGEVFTVVVGDAPEDIVYAWNRALLIPQWKRIDLNQLWLPIKLADDPKIEDTLKQWLQRAADPGGTTNEEILFVSFSLKKAELERIADKLTKNLWLRKTVTIFGEPETPNFQPRSPYLHLKENMDLYRATGNDEYIILNEPDVMEGVMAGEYWMADVYIQFRPEQVKDIAGMDFWWQFPQRNHLAYYIFRKPSRIRSDGFPSVLMRRGETILNIKLPDDHSIFLSLIVRENTPSYTVDPRAKFVKRPFDDVERSDKGRYLTGFLDVFSGLSFAYQILESRYWRRMFNILSHQNPAKDDKKREEIRNKIAKRFQSDALDVPGNPKDLEWLSEYILKLSKEQAATGKEISFEVFLEEAKRETEALNSSGQENEKFEFKEEDVRRSLHNLVELNILLMGIRPYCPLCGYINWYHIDEAQQILECKGCGYEYPLRPEEKWYYKLNSLVQVGCAQHGLIPVVLVLGQLFRESTSSFISTTSLDLFETRGRNSIGDLDIVCIKDGKFIIGEVKQSIGLFRESDFTKMGKIAKLLTPASLIFSSLDPQPNKLVTNNIATLKRALEPLGIDVRWYHLHSYVFDPSPPW
jgi:hypothetical protein